MSSSLKSRLQPYLATALTSRRAQRLRRRTWALVGDARAQLFLAPGDPYSWLLVQALIKQPLGLEVQLRWVDSLPAGAIPEPERQHAWALRDAHWLATEHANALLGGICGDAPSPKRSGAWANWLATQDLTLAQAHAALQRVWADEPPPTASARAREADEAALRNFGHMGHYWPGMLYFQGEWYWGLDRLTHLRARLDSTQPPADRWIEPVRKLPAGAPPLRLFWSARSPYAYLVLDRVIALAARHGAQLELLPVLPMVMRDMPVPDAKRFYILLDAKREADRNNIPFGFVCDPLGPATERCYAVLHAIPASERPRFAQAFATAVWSRGADASSDHGLRQIAEAAGVGWETVQSALQSSGWRDWVEHNRQTLLGLGLWGVPCMEWCGSIAWGQDRLAVVDQALHAAALKPIRS